MANNQTARQTYTFRDAKGQTARMQFYIRFDTALAADAANVGSTLYAALAAATNATLESAAGPFAFVGVPTVGTAATYVDVEDKARLAYLASSGTLHRFGLPAPKAAVFLADQQTVNKANALIAAITSAMHTLSGTAYVSDRGGGTYIATPFVGGLRSRSPVQRRMNIYTLSGNLDEPAE